MDHADVFIIIIITFLKKKIKMIEKLIFALHVPNIYLFGLICRFGDWFLKTTLTDF